MDPNPTQDTEVSTSPEKKPAVPPKRDDVLYQVVAARRQGTDSMMWQAPGLSLTAQAFLLTIALGSDTSRLGTIVAGLLALVVAIASMQLMAKHRAVELADSKWLNAFERKNWPEREPVHVQPKHRPFYTETCLGSWSSYVVWSVMLGVFGSAGLLAVATGVCGLDWLHAAK